MERGLRTLIDPVDDTIENKNVIEEILKPYVRVRREYLPNQELYASYAHAYGIEIKNGDMIWVLKNNATDVMAELEEFGC